MATRDNQKLKMLYLVDILSKETDDAHGLSLQEITDRLEAKGVNADRKNCTPTLMSLRNMVSRC